MSKADAPVVRQVPREGVVLQDVGESGLVGKEEGQVGGQDAVLDVAQDLPIFLGVQLGEDVVVLLLEDVDRHVEVVVLHGGGGVEDGQGRVHFALEGVIRATVVQIVAQTGDQ